MIIYDMKIKPLMELTINDESIIAGIKKGKTDNFVKMPLYHISRYTNDGFHGCKLIISNGAKIEDKSINEDITPILFKDNGDSYVLVQQSKLPLLGKTEVVVYVSYNYK